MDFASIRLITDNVDGLVQFYEQITGLSLVRATEDFAELRTPCCTLAIAGTRTIAMFGAEAPTQRITTPRSSSSASMTSTKSMRD